MARRVLVVSHFYPPHPGGIEVVAAQLNARVAGAGYGVTWAASGPAPGPAAPGALAAGVAALPMAGLDPCERALGFPYPLWTPRSLARLFAAVRASDIVQIHDFIYFGNLAAFVFAKMCGKPVVVNQHIASIPFESAFLRRVLALVNATLGRLVLSASSATVFHAENIRGYFQRFARVARKAELIPNGVASGVFRAAGPEARAAARARLGWDSGRPVVLFVGRFVERKGIHLLREVVPRFPAARWVFVGEGCESPAGWGMADVECIRSVEHERLAEYYQAADLVVHPSTGDAFALVLQEAIACGTPVLVSRELLEAEPRLEEAAFVCERTVEGIAGELRRILDDPEALPRARARVRRFAASLHDWDASARQHVALFERLLGPAKRARLPFWDHQRHVGVALRGQIEACLRRDVGLQRGACVVDLGCGDRPYEDLFADASCRYIACDIEGAADVRLEPGQPVALEAGAADGVVSFQVLEHVWDLDWYLGEARRLLKPDGFLLLSTHGTWPYHPHPTDYRRWTRDGLVRELTDRGFRVEMVRAVVGPLAWTTQIRLLGMREVLRRVPVVGGALVAAAACVMNARMLIEDAVTPPAMRDVNACVYVVVARPGAAEYGCIRNPGKGSPAPGASGR